MRHRHSSLFKRKILSYAPALSFDFPSALLARLKAAGSTTSDAVL
jgi:hypothetical protein